MKPLTVSPAHLDEQFDTTPPSILYSSSHDLISVILGNVFTTLLQGTSSNDAKKLIIDRFFHAVEIISLPTPMMPENRRFLLIA